MKKKIKLKDLTKEQWDNYVNSCISRSCSDCIFNLAKCGGSKYKESWINHKDLYSDKLLDQEIEIDIPNILTKEEKEYLASVIKPFKDKVMSIEKQTLNITTLGSVYRPIYYIRIQVENEFFTAGFQDIELPRFEENTRYQGMEIGKKYTLKDLGLNDKITLKQFWKSKEKLAIHCNTEEKANKLSRAFDKMGKKWCDGSRYIGNTCWDYAKENTCYSNRHGYCDINWFKKHGWKVYEFEDVDFGSYQN